MTEIIDVGTDLLDVFIGRQNIDKDSIRSNDNDISFDMCARDSDGETEKNIKRSTIDDVEDFFADTLQSRPFAQHLLLLLWIREVEFTMGTLKDDDVYDFLQKSAFALYNVDLDEETVEYEFLELLDEGYLCETNAGFSLSPKGRRVAEKLYKNDVCSDDAIAKLEEIIATWKKRSPISIALDTDDKPTERRNPKDRAKRIRKAAYEYYTELLKGNDVTKEGIAVKHGFTREKNVLSKERIQEKYGLDKLEQNVDEAIQFFGSIPKIEAKERARLLTLIYNTLKR